MKKATKLTLRHETVRVLAGSQLERVAGGVGDGTTSGVGKTPRCAACTDLASGCNVDTGDCSNFDVTDLCQTLNCPTLTR